MTTNDEILRLRADGLTQMEIAARLGVSQSTVSRILRADEQMPAGNEIGAVEQAVIAFSEAFSDASPEIRARLATLQVLASRLD